MLNGVKTMIIEDFGIALCNTSRRLFTNLAKQSGAGKARDHLQKMTLW